MKTNPPQIDRYLRGFTMVELLMVIAIIGLLIGLLIPTLSRSRRQARLITCGANLGSMGRGLLVYAGDGSGRFPYNGDSWEDATNTFTAVQIPTSFAWVNSLQRSMGKSQKPWLNPLRCPNVRDIPSWHETPNFDEPGSSWYLNWYCSGRSISSIPSPADGVLLLESGRWSKMSSQTGCLSFPQEPWMYPHPSGFLTSGEKLTGWDSWLTRRKSQPKRNILFCDCHVNTFAAKTWATGDQTADADRIKHMRFGLPGQNALDP